MQLLDTELLLDKLPRQPHHTLDQEGAMPTTLGKEGFRNPRSSHMELYSTNETSMANPLETPSTSRSALLRKHIVIILKEAFHRVARASLEPHLNSSKGLGSRSKMFGSSKTVGVIAGQSCYDLRSTLSLGRIIQSPIYLTNLEQGGTSERFDPFFPITPLDLSWQNIFDQ
ncbi:LOW QUALITY PROTEIN: hypothetical protein Cgig2_024773 [Carnegiea gigantea]|uniref:Uncharacterized protein n=1 Tax=Carnegiea gigantea TaxID=171969 RepID=A0A9Q1GXA6_9CARY|nr:LOW QUALITY PROTEIN: hypothetical protein Cgig2_024773 [Carnegiea gigantea]